MPATVPSGTATFGVSGQTTIDFVQNSVATPTSVGTITFTATAPAYTFQLNETNPAFVPEVLNITGTGIVNNSAVAPSFFVIGGLTTLNFTNASTAANATFSANANDQVFGIALKNLEGLVGGVNFYNTSTAANATMNNNAGGVYFHDASTAANVVITDFVGGVVGFFGTSSAGNATIMVAKTGFYNSSTAADATIVNPVFGVTSFFDSSSAANGNISNDGGTVSFEQTSTAANATIVNSNNTAIVKVGTLFQDASTAGNASITNNSNGITTLSGSSSAGTAHITNNSGGRTNITNFATADTATIVNNAGGIVDVSAFAAFSSPTVSIGSLSGNGNVFLGSRNLALGGLNSNDVIGGVITDGGQNGESGETGGSLTKVGAGTLTLAGTNTYTGGTTISAGTLQLGNGGTSGSIVGNVTNNANLIFNRSDAVTFGGAISGTGAVQHNGIGNTTLTAASTYTGLTNINAGTLTVNGSLVSSVNVNSGGTLMGTGTVGGINALSGGVVAPGNSIGTLNVVGPVAFGAGSTFQVEVNAAGQSDRIVATGAATLTGGTVQVLAAPGNYALNTVYNILHASSVTGTFAGVTSNLAFLAPTLTYDADDVFLTLVRNTSAFSTVAQTFNQRAVAGALDASAFGSTLVQAILPLTAPQSLVAFDQLSGEVHASTAGVLVDESRYMRGAVLGRLRQGSYGGETSMASLSTGGPQVAFADGELDSALAYGKSPIVTKAPRVAPPQGPDLAFWAQGFGARGTFDSDGNAASLKRDLAGFLTGFDARFGGNWRAGIAAGYTASRNSLDGRGTAIVESGHLAAYSGASVGRLNLRVGGAYAFHSIDTDRTIAFAGFFDRTTARYDGGTGQIFGEAGYGFAFGQVAVEPFAGAAWVHLKTDAANERGGAAALALAANSFEVGYSSLGIRAASMIPLGNDMMLIPRASVAWQHAFNSVTPTAALAFQSTAAAFVVAGVPIARDAVLAEAGFDLAIGRSTTLGVSYVGQLARNVHDHAAKGKFSWKF